ncbi:MAG: hypothetical protein JST01_19130 [Cyanobacteria bacterium SZAS TMP-1]|nr:hypothetical protein [Cyanobacteria bacterium SZAS TMP-1]
MAEPQYRSDPSFKDLLNLPDAANFSEQSGIGAGAYVKWQSEYQNFSRAEQPPFLARPAMVDAQASPLSVLEIAGDKPLREHVRVFGEGHKLDLSIDGNQIVYRMAASGSERELFRTDASEVGLARGDALLKALVVKEKQNLSDRYNISFAAEGEFVGNLRADAYSKPGAEIVTAREPELYELEGMKAALEKSVPGNLGQDNATGVKFYFLNGKLIQSLNPMATFQPDKNGKSSVYVWPGMANLDRITEADLTAAERSLAYTDPRRPESVASAITHELGHNQFAKLGYNHPKPSNDGTTDLTVRGEKLFNQMGWRRRRDQADADYNWFLAGKSRDDNGQPATFMPSNSTGMMWQFERWRLDGGAVDKNGKVVPADKAQFLSTEEMAKEAQVPLPTSYFENPEEEYAESVKLFRLGEESRMALRDSSPMLYKIVEQNDQLEINLAYGVDGSGAVKMVRDIDGRLVANSVDAQRRLAQFDSGRIMTAGR